MSNRLSTTKELVAHNEIVSTNNDELFVFDNTRESTTNAFAKNRTLSYSDVAKLNLVKSKSSQKQ